jgi:DNA polymerase I-like protein with 3'-5' exonuclease and polymerase domains
VITSIHSLSSLEVQPVQEPLQDEPPLTVDLSAEPQHGLPAEHLQPPPVVLVQQHELHDVIKELSKPGAYGLDCETMGLGESDKLFSFAISTKDRTYYFNFNDNAPPEYTLQRVDITYFKPIFDSVDHYWFIHNAKFDMAKLLLERLQLKGTVHCTEAIARVVQNNHLGYKLAHCAPRDLGLSKDESVDKYISKHKLFEWQTIPGKTKRHQKKFFAKVPFELMTYRGGGDAHLHRALGEWQLANIAAMDRQGYKPLAPLVATELALTKVLFKMEREGIEIDPYYTLKAQEHEVQIIKKLEAQFQADTGLEFQDGPKRLVEAFKTQGLELPKTPLGNPSKDADALESLNHPLANLVLSIRGAKQRVGTYYSSFLYLKDHNNIIHPNFRQGGTETGRMSCSNPNLQNVPKGDEPEDLISPFSVRKCFVPPEGACFVMIDYAQQEYRLMLDWAGEMALIKAVMDGADVHQATADLLGIPRKYAKNLNFAILYGAGPEQIAYMSGIKIREARELRELYFGKLPKVKRFIYDVSGVGKSRGFVVNWYGRRCHIAKPEWSYALPNHIVQGGCADVVKKAMVAIDPIFRHRSGMRLQVHDELVNVYYPEEFDLIKKQVDLMESVYEPKNGMKMTVSVEHSWKSWGKLDAVKGVPV